MRLGLEQQASFFRVLKHAKCPHCTIEDSNIPLISCEYCNNTGYLDGFQKLGTDELVKITRAPIATSSNEDGQRSMGTATLYTSFKLQLRARDYIWLQQSYELYQIGDMAPSIGSFGGDITSQVASVSLVESNNPINEQLRFASRDEKPDLFIYIDGLNYLKIGDTPPLTVLGIGNEVPLRIGNEFFIKVGD